MWWIWMGLAAIFLIGEIFAAGFFLIFLSVGSAAAGILALLDVNRVGQFIVFIVVSGILFVFGRRFADRVTQKQPPGIGADRFVDQRGVVLETIDNSINTGRVRVGQDEWRAISATGDILQTGTPIRVTQIDGTRAIVEKIEKEDT
jgi:membrane protein implicated in regulation of membrane protease activity